MGLIRDVDFRKRALLILAVCLLVAGWGFNVPSGLLGKADAVGYAVCHRIDARSFHLGDRQVPLCARCSGMYLGAISGVIYQFVFHKKRGGMPGWPIWIVLGFFVFAFGADGLNSYLSFFPNAPTVYEPQNWLRLVTGSGMGLAMSVVIVPAFNQSVWENWDRKPVFASFFSMVPLLCIVAVVNLLVLTENPLVMYPLAIISSGGVLVILTMVYSMMWLMIQRAENSISDVKQMILPLVGGFGMAMIQIILLDGLRFALTGTWDGFHIG